MGDATRDNNRVPSLIAKSDADNSSVVIEADPATKRLKVSAVITSGGSAGAQYTDGDATITHPIGTIPVYDKAGTITAVSVANPLPVSATISTAGLATSTKQSDGTQKTQIVDGSGNVIASTSNALNTSTNITNSSIAVTNTGTFATQPTLQAGSNLVGKVGIDQTTPGTTNAVVDTPVTSGGLLIVTGSIGATATAIKASAGQLYGYHLFNTTAAVAYVQIFNVAAGSVTLGTTAPTISIGIPASGGVTVNFDKGIAFGTAISFAGTTTRTGSSGATVDCNFFYK